jgi:hypothetical protein
LRADTGWWLAGVELWESQEAFERFGQRLLPLLQETSFPPAEAPRIFPVQNVVTQ